MKKLYVGNLSYEVTEEELVQIFSQCGQVTSAKLVIDQETGRSKGFGFVEMPSDDEAHHAIDRMRGQEIKGRPLIIDEAKDKPMADRGDFSQRRDNRGGGGGRGRR